MDFSDLQSFFVVLLAIAGAIACIGGAINIIRGWVKPARDNNREIMSMLDNDCRTLKRHDAEIDDLRNSIDDLKKDNSLLLRMTLELMNHMIDGNGIERMKQLRNEIQAEILGR